MDQSSRATTLFFKPLHRMLDGLAGRLFNGIALLAALVGLILAGLGAGAHDGDLLGIGFGVTGTALALFYGVGGTVLFDRLGLVDKRLKAIEGKLGIEHNPSDCPRCGGA